MRKALRLTTVLAAIGGVLASSYVATYTETTWVRYAAVIAICAQLAYLHHVNQGAVKRDG